MPIFQNLSPVTNHNLKQLITIIIILPFKKAI